MNILVISDLHTGVKAFPKELSPYPRKNIFADEDAINRLIEFLKDYKSSKGSIDYLVLPGDITHQSNLIEYHLGGEFIKNIVSILSLDESKIIFTPGNHDVDWSVFSGIEEEEKNWRRAHKYNTLVDSRHLFSKITHSKLLETPFFTKWEFDDVIFFGFNSSWHDDSIQEKHYGFIEISHIEQLKLELESTDLKKLKIFVTHHHLHQFDNPHPKWIDVSAMQNAQSLLNLLSEYSFQFVIHGHRHVPYFLTTSIANFSPINILCSGSFSCEVPAQIAGYVGNMFHIIEFDEYSENVCKGQIVSLAYDNRTGWIQSKSNHGIDYLNPFGTTVKLEILLAQCETELNSLLETKSVVKFDELKLKIPDLAYLPLHSLISLLDQLQSICSCMKGSTGEGIIFIKQ